MTNKLYYVVAIFLFTMAFTTAGAEATTTDDAVHQTYSSSSFAEVPEDYDEIHSKSEQEKIDAALEKIEQAKQKQENIQPGELVVIDIVSDTLLYGKTEIGDE